MLVADTRLGGWLVMDRCRFMMLCAISSRSCAVILAAISRALSCAALTQSLPRRWANSLLRMLFGVIVGDSMRCDFKKRGLVV